MTWEYWKKKYRPIKNELVDAPIDGLMFETYGKEFKAVKLADNQNPFTVWTVIDGRRNSCYAITGMHFVNRLGFFICKVPFTKADEKTGLSVKI